MFYVSFYLLLSLAANLQYGYTGQPNFGLILYTAVAAYSATDIALSLELMFAHLSIQLPPSYSLYYQLTVFQFYNLLPTVASFVLTFILSLIISAIIGLLTVLPMLRLREDYLAITLLAFSETFRVIANSTTPIFGGAVGIRGTVDITSPLHLIGYSRDLFYGFLSLGFLLLFYYLTSRITNSPYGRVLKSIRDDEETARVFGKNIYSFKRQVMMLGAIIAGSAGILQAFYINFISSDQFTPILTFQAIFIAILGGIANNKGTLLAGLIYTIGGIELPVYIQSYLRPNLPFPIDYLRYIIIAIALVLILIYRPKGILPEKPIKTPALEVIENERGSESN
jgi:branched-chain amino acid transport system permease protein